MKANIPRSYRSLPPAEQAHIKQLAYELAREQFEKDVMLIMDQLLKMSCFALHTTFGFGKKRMTYYLASYRRIFKRYIKANREGILMQELDAQMQHIFRKEGYPDDIFSGIFENWTVKTNKGDTDHD